MRIYYTLPGTFSLLKREFRIATIELTKSGVRPICEIKSGCRRLMPVPPIQFDYEMSVEDVHNLAWLQVRAYPAKRYLAPLLLLSAPLGIASLLLPFSPLLTMICWGMAIGLFAGILHKRKRPSPNGYARAFLLPMRANPSLQSQIFGVYKISTNEMELIVIAPQRRVQLKWSGIARAMADESGILFIPHEPIASEILYVPVRLFASIKEFMGFCDSVTAEMKRPG